MDVGGKTRNLPFRLGRAACCGLSKDQLVIGLLGCALILCGFFAFSTGIGAGQLAMVGGFACLVFAFVITFFALIPGWPNDKIINDTPRPRKIIIKINRLVWESCPGDRPPRFRLA
ncbi:hypothetical protein [Dentiradicibacter hellwigii]|uniref:Uncharacterized protein n=1 Tax=Dentiradicibacter hellwigii TaxID=3149053 RepID=A0ABV4UDE2_9RHOO